MENWRKYIRKFNENDEEIIIQAVPNAAAEAWIEQQVPKFECSNQQLEENYYFRWWVFRKHIKEIGGSRIITEFLPPVNWAGPENSINCANGHHLAEARWLKQDRHLAQEYIRFWLTGEGHATSYSSWLGDALYQYALATDEQDFAVEMLLGLVRYYETVEAANMTRYGLFWSYDDRDAMELSISGSGLRPTLNSYMYANALAISEIAGWAGQDELGREYRQKAERLKQLMLKMLWDPEKEFFKVVPQHQKDDVIEEFDLTKISPKHNALEELGYIPWAFGIPGKEHDGAWKYLMDQDYFRAPMGITTAQQNHPLFMNTRSPHDCQWNGPVWPFATSQTLNSMIELLKARTVKEIDRADFLVQLELYSESHFLINDQGQKVNWIDEDQDPYTGQWIARERLKALGWLESKGGYERGKDYNHSTFNDLIIRGLCGITILPGSKLAVCPLVPKGQLEYFKLKELPYKNHLLSVSYQQGVGLQVEVDGKLAAAAPGLSKLEIDLSNYK